MLASYETEYCRYGGKSAFFFSFSFFLFSLSSQVTRINVERERDNFNRHANFIEEIKRADNARRRRVVVPRPRLETGAKKNVTSRNDFAFGNFNVTSDEDDSPDARGKIFRISKQQVGGKRSRRRRRRREGLFNYRFEIPPPLFGRIRNANPIL